MARTHDDTRRFRRQGLRVLVDYSCDGGIHVRLRDVDLRGRIRRPRALAS